MSDQSGGGKVFMLLKRVKNIMLILHKLSAAAGPLGLVCPDNRVFDISDLHLIACPTGESNKHLPCCPTTSTLSLCMGLALVPKYISS